MASFINKKLKKFRSSGEVEMCRIAQNGSIFLPCPVGHPIDMSDVSSRPPRMPSKFRSTAHEDELFNFYVMSVGPSVDVIWF